MTLATIEARLDAATTQAEGAAQILYDIAHGDDDTSVTTDNGPVNSVAKAIKAASQIILAAGGSPLGISESAPDETLYPWWFKPSTLTLKIWYDNGIDPADWLSLTGSITEAALDGLSYVRQNGDWVGDIVIRNQDDFDQLVPLSTIDTVLARHFADDTVYRFRDCGMLLADSGANPIGLGSNTILISDTVYSDIIVCDSIVVRGDGAGGAGNYSISGVSILTATEIFTSAPSNAGGEVSIIKNAFLGGSCPGGTSKAKQYEWTGVVPVVAATPIVVDATLTGDEKATFKLKGCTISGNSPFSSDVRIFDITGRVMDVEILMTECTAEAMQDNTGWFDCDGDSNLSGVVVSNCKLTNNPTGFEWIQNVDQTSDFVTYTGNLGIGNTVINGALLMSEATPVLTAITGTAYNLLSLVTALNSGASGFIRATENQLVRTRQGSEAMQISLSSDAVSGSGSGTNPYRVAVYKNGSILTDAGKTARRRFACNTTDWLEVSLVFQTDVRGSSFITDTTIASPVVNVLGQDMSRLANGQVVNHANFAAGTTVSSFNTGTGDITFSANASASTSGVRLSVGDSFRLYAMSIDGGDDLTIENMSLTIR
jgi:hypothetical protein